MNNSSLNKDINEFMEFYPKFESHERPGKKYNVVNGEIDICDKKGNYWQSFIIKIYLDKDKYPYCIPKVFETSSMIDRDIDWHISEEGYCCLDIPHELEYLSKRGINLTKFFQTKIYPFFANVEYKKMSKDYANGEYLHHFDGVVQFYKEKLGLKNPQTIVRILDLISKNEVPGRNDMCICGMNKKFKYCHFTSINFIRSLSADTIHNDLANFKQNKNYD